ncbi:RNA polymerase sigma factor [Bacillus suaedae]|uniref:RNA polymerase sigma factor n=1 Tax=Halalkalibacter suaedae TaxID=2822140 RepID=A0A941ASX8_9BACI|nr:RNA polymerase sigma factor [Bacillus suaedae]MBP3950234.1 RNA polymerase sigma factor [Bacillus suaedae]
MDHAEKKKLIQDWYNQYSKQILKYIALMTKDYSQAEDLTHETFLKAYDYMDGFKGRSHIKTWLFRIAHNTTIDYLRKRKPLMFVKGILDQVSERTPEQIVIEGEEAVTFYEALHRIKPKYREVIILRKVKGFSIKETAEILSLNENTLKSLLRRGLVELGKQLKEEGFSYEV